MKYIPGLLLGLALAPFVGIACPLTDTIAPTGKKVAAIDFDATPRQLTVKYVDGSSERLSENEANERGLIHNAGYGNFAAVPVSKSSSNIRFNGDTVKPLIVLDGHEYKGELADIQPGEIQSINVLKGESATAKYGVKGRAGVVEIQSKPVVSSSPSAEKSDEWQGKKIYQLVGAQATDDILGFVISVEDADENIQTTEQRGNKLTDASRKVLAKARKGSLIIFEKIYVKRSGQTLNLPSAYYKP